MAYSEAVAEKIREALKMHKGLSERKMFGGIAFMLNGHMCCGVLEKNLVLRLGESAAAQALTKPHTRLMDFTGKPLKTMGAQHLKTGPGRMGIGRRDHVLGGAHGSACHGRRRQRSGGLTAAGAFGLGAGLAGFHNLRRNRRWLNLVRCLGPGRLARGQGAGERDDQNCPAFEESHAGEFVRAPGHYDICHPLLLR